VTRDFGFVTGAIGVASSVFGAALLGGAVCDSWSSTARGAGGAIALGLGIPMAAMGWSLYYIHRTITVEDRVLNQAGRNHGVLESLTLVGVSKAF
jgi:hypothetical protein